MYCFFFFFFFVFLVINEYEYLGLPSLMAIVVGQLLNYLFANAFLSSQHLKWQHVLLCLWATQKICINVALKKDNCKVLWQLSCIFYVYFALICLMIWIKGYGLRNELMVEMKCVLLEKYIASKRI